MERILLHEVQGTRNLVRYTGMFIISAACYFENPFYANKVCKSCAARLNLFSYFIDNNCWWEMIPFL